ncbi:MAG: hypothetical protein V2I26_11440, partial [Halieaceae bacterium]|nr:hypothetical protein [Halieaceae bacterium]
WALGPTGTAVPVAYIEYNAALTPTYQLYSELHPADITRGEHAYLHNTRGARYASGGVLVDATLQQSTDVGNVFGVTEAVYYDETLRHTVPALTKPDGATAIYTVRYREGGAWLWSLSDVPFRYSGTYIYWDNVGTETAAENGDFVCTYLLLTPNGHQIIHDQAVYASLALAQAAQFQSLVLTGLAVAEFVAVEKLIWRCGSAYTQKGKCRLEARQRINVSSIPAASVPVVLPPQISSEEITAGTETALRSYAPTDVVAIVDAHAPSGGTGNSTITYSGTAPTEPATGDQWVNAGIEYTWDGNYWVQTSTIHAMAVGSTSLTQSAQTITDTGVTGAVNTHYLCTIAGLTANRALTLPAGTAGDKIRVTILDGDADYGLEIKGASGISINGGTAAATWRTLSAAGYSVEFEVTSASNWQVTVSSGERVLLSDQTANDDASLIFALPLGFSKFELQGVSLGPAIDNNLLNIHVSTDGASSFVTSSSYARMTILYANATTSNVGGSNADTRIVVAGLNGNAAGEVANFDGVLMGSEAGHYFQYFAQTMSINASAQNVTGTAGGRYTASTDRVTHCRFSYDTGNIATGRIRLYGIY